MLLVKEHQKYPTFALSKTSFQLNQHIPTELTPRIFSQSAPLYHKTPIPLNHKDPYTLLIAVLLSAQCTDKRVNQVTPQLFELANSPLKMQTLTIQKIKSIVKPCGLAQRKATRLLRIIIATIIHLTDTVLKRESWRKTPER